MFLVRELNHIPVICPAKAKLPSICGKCVVELVKSTLVSVIPPSGISAGVRPVVIMGTSHGKVFIAVSLGFDLRLPMGSYVWLLNLFVLLRFSTVVAMTTA